MKLRFPLIPTIIVTLAIATMIGLGTWQLQRKAQKEALIAQYEAASDLPAIAWPSVPLPDELPLFRKSKLMCIKVQGWSSIAGKSARGQSGFAHIATCQTGGMEGPGAKIAIGWSPRPDHPTWAGGEISGVIAPDNQSLIRLVASEAPDGLEPLATPSTEGIPNNHLSYAIQWFLFAGAAAVIYILALKTRRQGR
ncbi:MAG: SURF1 family protein [Sphingorhabdus sp.]